MLLHALPRDEVPAQQVFIIRRTELLFRVIASVGTDTEAVRVIEKHPRLGGAAAPMVPRYERQSDMIAVFAGGPEQLGKVDEAIVVFQQRIVNDDAGTQTWIAPALVSKSESQKNDGGNVFVHRQFKFFFRRQWP